MLFSSLLLASAASAVVIIPGGGNPKPYTGLAPVTSEDAFFRQSAPNEFFNNTAKLIMTSLSVTNSSSSSPGLRPSGDSFIRGAIQAWGEHLHLVIRPDEVWFTILVQLNFYMISHAEEIRLLFVSHDGQQEILIKDYTWYDILSRFKTEIQKRVKTPWLLDWLVPSFSTTTDSDVMTANILMMGLTKAYFKYIGKQVCGLPSVTLLGTQTDWELLLSKLDRLADFGPEPAEYATRLRPILTRFVTSFSEPDSPATRLFWNQIVSGQASHMCGAPPVYISGWITGFYYWNERGGAFARASHGRKDSVLSLDEVEYYQLDLETVPVGYARAPFTMLDYDDVVEFPAYVAAGLLGKEIMEGPPEGYTEALRRVGGEEDVEGLLADLTQHGTLRPMSGWMLYGPVDHNKTVEQYGVEDEVLEVLISARRGMTGMETCPVLDE